MLEGGLAQRPGAEQHDAGILGIGRGHRLQGGPQGTEEGGQPVDLGIAVEAREHPGDDDPVLQRVPCARRRLGVVGQHRAATPRVAGEVHGDREQLLVARDADLVAWPQEAVVAQDHGGREQPPAQQLAGTVQIGEDQVQQLGPLHHAELDAGPLVAGQQHGDGVEGPGISRRLRGVGGSVGPVDVVGHAVVVEQAAGLGLAVQQLVEAEAAHDLADVGPVVADAAVRGEHLVVGPRHLTVRGEEVGRRGDRHEVSCVRRERQLVGRTGYPRTPGGRLRSRVLG